MHGVGAPNVSGAYGTLPAANGGTGQAGGYAVGDLLYASAAGTLSKLAAVAAGVPLMSAGATTAPAWDAAGLYCRLRNSAAISTDTGATKVLDFDTEIYDTNGFHEGVTNPSRITFAKAGKYRVGASIQFAASAIGYRYLDIKLNNTTLLVVDARNTVGTTDELHVETEYEFAANDYIEARAFQNSTATINVSAINPRTPAFWASRIGS